MCIIKRPKTQTPAAPPSAAEEAAQNIAVGQTSDLRARLGGRSYLRIGSKAKKPSGGTLR